MKKKTTYHNLRLGLLIVAGLAFFIVSIYLLGKQQNLFESVIKIRSTFSDVKGLKIGNNVRFSGIDIGTVSDIQIKNDSTVMVVMSIKRDVIQFVRKNSTAEIVNEGLIGNKIINIHPGSPNQPVVEENDILPSQKTLTTEDLLAQAKSIMVDGKLITENLAEVSARLLNGNGDFAVLLNENSISQNLKKASLTLARLTGQLEQISQKINNGNGDIAKLLNEDTITVAINSIMDDLDSTAITLHRITENLYAASEQIKQGDNVINKLLYDSVMANDLGLTVKKVNAGLDEARQAAKTIHNSWALNLFSKKKNRKNNIKNEVNSDDSLKHE